MDEKDLATRLRSHSVWLRSAGGERLILTGANLQEADLTEADLTEADLQGANLQEADLTGADLQGANLQEANLREADLQGADLTGADLRGVKRWSGVVEWWLTLEPLGSRRDALRVWGHSQGTVLETGCWHGTPEEFATAVAARHGDSQCGQEYMAALGYIRAEEARRNRVPHAD